jgi:protein TonB
MNRASTFSEDNLLYYTLLVAVALHGLLILGLSFDLPPLPPEEPEQSLEITVVRPTPTEPPDQAQFIAEADQVGSGNIEEVAKPTVNPAMEAPATVQTALHNQTEPSPPPQPEEPEPAEIEPEIAAPETAKLEVTKSRPGDARRRPRLTATQLLANMQREIEDLTAELDRKTRLYAQRPRRKAISAATREHRYATYLEAWRRKVEYVGNLNYPDEARRHRIYGDLILHVAVRANGAVDQIRVVRSSGHSVLDEAAVSIVELAAPFAPFPDNIKSEVDILDITRTWQFLRGDRLGSR